MSNSSELSSLVHARRICGVVAAAVLGVGGLLAILPSAHAALGGSPMATPDGASAVSSTSAAAAMRSAVPSGAMSAMGASVPTASFTVRQTTLATGTVVREYLSPAGVVFGVAWRGPAMPALSEIFGSTYFQQYVAGAKAARAARGAARGPAVVEQNGLVVHSGGHMGAFAGSAWLPQALPAGVSGADIQ